MRFLLCLLPFFCLLQLILTVQGTHHSRVRPARQQQNPQNLPANTNANANRAAGGGNPSGQTNTAGGGTNRNVPPATNAGQGGGPRGQAHLGTGGLKKRYSGFPDADDVDMSRSRWRSRDYPDGRNRIDGRRDDFYPYYRNNEDIVVKRDIEPQPLPVPPVNTNGLFKREAGPQPPSPASQMNTNNRPAAAGNLQPPNDGQSG